METETLSAGTPEETKEAVREAVKLLNNGSIVALPTETVYGLAANAFNAEACAAIFEVKERPSFDPLIVHVSGKKMLDSIVDIPPDIEKTLEILIQEFWPGPLTLVARAASFCATDPKRIARSSGRTDAAILLA